MLKVSEKRGQFYLLATVVILSLIVGFFAITNFSNTAEKSRVKQLAKELDSESEKILELGATTGDYPWIDFTGNFSKYAGNDVEIFYTHGAIDGSSPYLTFYYINKSGNKVGVGGGEFIPYYTEPIMTVNFKATNYSFKLRQGQNFYYIITQDINGERYVETSSY